MTEFLEAIEDRENAYHCPITFYRCKFDMAGLNRALQNKNALCGHCYKPFNQKFIRFDRYGIVICPNCVLKQKLGGKKEALKPNKNGGEFK